MRLLLILFSLSFFFTSSQEETILEPKLENIKWLAGNWKGEAMGGTAEENWTEPHGDSMMASFKIVRNGKVMFYEIEVIREIENTLILQLKHFNNDLTGWEEKNETIDFPLKAIYANKIVFEGMTFELTSENKMTVTVDMENNGKTSKLAFHYTRD